MKTIPRLVIPFLIAGCGSNLGNVVADNGGQGATDVSALSDEFDSAASLAKWQRVEKVEGWNNDQLEKVDASATRAGWLTMVPYTSTWYQDYRGILLFKPVNGDFMVTAKLHVSGRSGGPPRAQFSLGGLMIRTPRTITPSTWRQGTENYVFLSVGAANEPGRFQFEVKTTINSDSQLVTAPAPSGDALIRLVRVGESVIALRNSDDGWTVHRRYRRGDFPATLQVGMTCYTDYPGASRMDPPTHNRSVIRDGNPDLIAQYDYIRFARPKVPSSLAGRELDDPSISDAQLLAFLGGA
jgi:hypothetical protein